VAVFVGTSGIGETALEQFAKQVVRPVCYIVGRSREVAGKIITECKISNPDGQYIFIKGVVNLMSGWTERAKRLRVKIVSLISCF
jgi:hypothetical protein